MSSPERTGVIGRVVRRLAGTSNIAPNLERQREDTSRILKTLRHIDERLGSLERGQAARDVLTQRQLKQIRLDVRGVQVEMSAVRTQLGSRGVTKILRLLRMDTRAVLRKLHLSTADLPFPHALVAERFSLSSQGEEDGICHAIFRRVGSGSHRFIDIGCGMDGGISSFYGKECGWSGLMIDANEAHIESVRERFSRRRITAVAAMVDRDNINRLISENGFGGEVDLLSIDIDGVDYWVWEALSACSPRLLVIEYNALFGLERSVTVPYDAAFDRGRHTGLLRSGYCGASLRALIHLAGRKGYRLVTVEPAGVNAFFLRNDVGPEIPACDIDDLPFAAVKTARYQDLMSVITEAGLPLVDIQ